ncbi:malate synthase A [Chondromyces apiculatus]|uniref:malate synthase A n=1 Tax=Chondromyces apiculatus TaxID=51 RepID=UPI0005C5CE20
MEPTTLSIRAPRIEGDEIILTPEARLFLAELGHAFSPKVSELLERRRRIQERLDSGVLFDFLPETKAIRDGEWTVADVPHSLRDRRVEITGPVDRKMIINALNSGANVFMADFEDSSAPTWANLITGQVALYEAVRGSLRHEDASSGKHYSLNEQVASLMVRPRGLHLPERHIELNGRPLPAALVDFGLFFFHNARVQVERGVGPWFYLPKLESHLEARLWNDVFLFAQQALGMPPGTVKATVLIETLPAAFEMDEILYELRQHSAGLNCGRWDYIFSFIKKLRRDPACVLPDRDQITMKQHFLRSYTQLLVKTCHRRKAHAMGGMAAFIPIKSDPEQNRLALDKVRADKQREVEDGHDGTWVAHPGLIQVAREIFDAHMPGPNQIERQRDDVSVSAPDLLRVPEGSRTEVGLRHNIRVGVQYIEAWLRGLGCVPLYNLMEDAATAEISRSQVWQWLRHRAVLDDGQVLTPERFRQVLDEEMHALRVMLGAAYVDGHRFSEARELFERLSTSEAFEEFLTLPAYDLLLNLTE